LAKRSTERKGTPIKQKRVVTLTDQLKRAQMAIVTDYRGMKMAELSDLRIQLRKNNGEFHIVKNTLVRIAEEKSGATGLESELSGTTAIAFCYGDVAATAKLLTDFARTSKFLKIRSALLQGQLIPSSQLQAVANLPPKPVLQAQLLGALQGPSASLVAVLSGPMQGLLAVMQARAAQIEAS
jgi:large subunit ribosomal protein L10